MDRSVSLDAVKAAISRPKSNGKKRAADSRPYAVKEMHPVQDRVQS